MSQASEAAEPTMEEILASIRRIIADDVTDGDEENIMSGSEAATEADDTDEDLAAWDADSSEDEGGPELSQDDLDSLFDDEEAEDTSDMTAEEMAADLGPDEENDEADSAAELDAEPEPADDLDVTFAPEPDPDPEPEPEDDVFELSEDLAIAEEAPSVEGLISSSAEHLVAAQLGLLSNLNVPNGGPTLESLVKELLRPMMKIWLDENLPPLVEEIVRQEIERISKGHR